MGRTVEALAIDAGMPSPLTWVRLEQGEQRLTLDGAGRVARALGRTLGWLVGECPDPVMNRPAPIHSGWFRPEPP